MFMKKQFTLTVVSLAAIIGFAIPFGANAEMAQQNQSVQIVNELEVKPLPDNQAQQMTTAALQVLSLIDQGKSGEIWDGLSPTIKPVVNKISFVQMIVEDQGNFGSPSKRERTAAYLSDSNGGNNIPKGTYYSVVFKTQFSKAQGVELVSFRFDNDQIWRVAGYSLARVTGK